MERQGAFTRAFIPINLKTNGHVNTSTRYRTLQETLSLSIVNADADRRMSIGTIHGVLEEGHQGVCEVMLADTYGDIPPNTSGGLPTI